MSDEKRVPLSVRVPAELKAALEARARRDGSDLSEQVRQVLAEYLEDRTNERLLEMLEEVRDQVERSRNETRQLRSDVASALEMTLVNLASISKEQVQQYVSRYLRDT